MHTDLKLEAENSLFMSKVMLPWTVKWQPRIGLFLKYYLKLCAVILRY